MSGRVMGVAVESVTRAVSAAFSAPTEHILAAALVVLVTVYVVLPRLIGAGRKEGKQVPMAPGGLPIIGHLLKLGPEVILSYFHQNWVDIGGPFELSIVGKRALVLTEWEGIKDVLLRRPKMFRRDSGMDSWGREINVLSGLFNVEGAEWGRIRRLSSSSFAPHHVDSMSEIITDECKAFLKRLDAAVAIQASTDKPIDGVEVLMQYTMNIIINLAFGTAALKSSYLQSPEVIHDMKSLFAWIYRRLTVPLPNWLWGLYNDSLEKKGKHCSVMLERVVADIKKSIEESDDASCGDTTTMFLSSLMKSRISDDSSDFNSRNHLSDTEIAAQIKTFLIAGTETTAVTIASAVQYLSDPKYSDLANALYMETKNCFLGERYPSSLDQLRNMPLVSAFLKESMRLHGPAPLSFNELAESQKSTIISGGYTVYKTVSVGIKYIIFN